MFFARSSAKRRWGFRPMVETMEDRLVPSTVTIDPAVTSPYPTEQVDVQIVMPDVKSVDAYVSPAEKQGFNPQPDPPGIDGWVEPPDPDKGMVDPPEPDKGMIDPPNPDRVWADPPGEFGQADPPSEFKADPPGERGLADPPGGLVDADPPAEFKSDPPGSKDMSDPPSEADPPGGIIGADTAVSAIQDGMLVPAVRT